MASVFWIDQDRRDAKDWLEMKKGPRLDSRTHAATSTDWITGTSVFLQHLTEMTEQNIFITANVEKF